MFRSPERERDHDRRRDERRRSRSWSRSRSRSNERSRTKPRNALQNRPQVTGSRDSPYIIVKGTLESTSVQPRCQGNEENKISANIWWSK
ncbi:hypothetical protein J6590_057440 [Homalodisca vitripennis]|nr:hypothetical protein J6590_057440 [Homalodisca vitripennis]